MRTTRSKAIDAPDAEDYHEEDDDEDAEPEYQPRKRQRTSIGGSSAATSRGKGKGRRKASAKLESMNEMPLDILAEICGNLDLETIYSFSRVSKNIRAFLTAPVSRPLWEQARINSRLPELAVPLNSLAYAKLMFGNDCDFCGAVPRQRGLFKPDFVFRLRMCPECIETKTCELDNVKLWLQIPTTISREQPAWQSIHHVQSLCPDSVYDVNGRLKKRHEHLNSEVDEVYDKIIAFQKDRPDLVDYDVDDDDDDDDDAEVPPPHHEADRYVIQREEHVENIQEDAQLLRDWIGGRQAEKEGLKDVIRARRRNDIETRFRALGWGDADFATVKWNTQTLLHQAKDLTDRTWTTVQPALLQVLELQQEEVREKARSDAQSARRRVVQTIWRALLKDEAKATALGLFPLPVFNKFMALDSVEPQWKPLNLTTLTEESFVASYPLIAAELARIRLQLKEEVFAQVIEEIKRLDATSLTPAQLPIPAPDGSFTDAQMDSIFSRPSTVICCVGCGMYASFSVATEHQCSRPPFSSSYYGLGRRTVIAGGSLNEAANFSAGGGAIAIARNVLMKAGLDEATATDADVSALDHRLSCRTCSIRSLAGTCVSFYSIVKHYRAVHFIYDTLSLDRMNLEYHASESEQLAEFLKLSKEQEYNRQDGLYSESDDSDYY